MHSLAEFLFPEPAPRTVPGVIQWWEKRRPFYNVAVGDRTTLTTLFELLRDGLLPYGVAAGTQPVYRGFRAGDVRHSQADISKAQSLLGYQPTHRIRDGLAEAMRWYVQRQQALKA